MVRELAKHRLYLVGVYRLDGVREALKEQRGVHFLMQNDKKVT